MANVLGVTRETIQNWERCRCDVYTPVLVALACLSHEDKGLADKLLAVVNQRKQRAKNRSKNKVIA